MIVTHTSRIVTWYLSLEVLLFICDIKLHILSISMYYATHPNVSKHQNNIYITPTSVTMSPFLLDLRSLLLSNIHCSKIKIKLFETFDRCEQVSEIISLKQLKCYYRCISTEDHSSCSYLFELNCFWKCNGIIFCWTFLNKTFHLFWCWLFYLIQISGVVWLRLTVETIVYFVHWYQIVHVKWT